MQPDDYLTLSYLFTPNYPANVSDEADVAQKLKGLVSDETLLRVLSIVDDPAAELEKMRDETASAYTADIYRDRGGSSKE